ncbi:phosphoribosylamine--glycine ligase [Corynebacterium mendelii]|uniref:Phosphoribosylamine--glycine ligase n=1 Tax=Corynebacterium mendelii TaxID=2765362 RepID=A0A939E156_9CORY|nr:phosphoribosylamine--glycine ligase [Corynebacterium mendelii]MBN9645054.1 phosphoribosylamine--glycine ligase [Corynebacterium mendelii]
MRVLLIGSGAREHALAQALTNDPQVTDIHVTPGNPGMAGIATVHTQLAGQPLAVDDPRQMADLAAAVGADLVVIGPEQPLVAGVADVLREQGFAVFGPNKQAAMIEGSKLFAKDVMQAAGVATAGVDTLTPETIGTDLDGVLDRMGPVWVVKDDGLAGGKGVVVTDDRDAAAAHARAVAAAGHDVLFETFLDGPEVSLFCLVDGTDVVPLLPAQDHKRAHDGDNGPNTGGMGAYCPLPWLPDGAVDYIVDHVVTPVAEEMAARGCAYSGLLYAGLAWGSKGPAVVEFNCRFGDPETQAVLALLRTPLGGLLKAVADGRLAEHPPLVWEDGFACTVVLAAEGYPAQPVTGGVITGCGQTQPGTVLHAGTATDDQGRLVAAGGRVLNVIGKGASLQAARDHAYGVLKTISLPGGFYRSDIARTDIDRTVRLPD